MISDTYANIVLFAATPREQGAFSRFYEFFNLLEPDLNVVYEITNWKSGEILHEERALESAIEYLDANPDLCLDLYLGDRDENIFTFSCRPPDYHMMSIPYGLLTVEQIMAFIREFNIAYAWGTGEDSSPPDSIQEIEAASGFASSPFVHYRDGKLLLGRDLVG